MSRLFSGLILAFFLVGCDRFLGETKNIHFVSSVPVLKEDEAIIVDRLNDHASAIYPSYNFSTRSGETVILAKGAPSDTSIQFLLSHRGQLKARSESGIPWFSNKDIMDVAASFDDQQRSVLKLRLSPEGAAHVARLSTAGVGTTLVLELDGENLTSAKVAEPLTKESFQVSINKTPDEASLIATILRTGVLSFAPEHIYTEAVN